MLGVISIKFQGMFAHGAVVALVLLAGGASAATLTVCPSGCVYSSIQAAINAASAEDTILVQSGTYYENVNINKRLILRGSDTGAGKPAVDSSGSGSVITISSNGSVVDGFYVTGSGAKWGQAGIRITSENNEIVNNIVSNNSNGIFFEEPYGGHSSNNNTVTGNIVNYNNEKGIYVYRSHYNIILNNTASSNTNDGINLGHSSHNRLFNNVANSNKDDGIGLSEDSDYNILINNTANFNYDSGINLYNSYNNIFDNNTLSVNENGIGMTGSNNNTFINNTINANTDCGIYLDTLSNHNSIINNNISSNNDIGMNFDDSFYNKITGNIVLNNSNGIYLDHSSNNTITNNFVSLNSDDGIELEDSADKNTIKGNTISLNKGTGIQIKLSYNNLIYHNNLINNVKQADDDGNNFWDNGYPSGGNYWSDYTGSDSNGDSLGDIPYNIIGSAGAQDRYPLMNPWETTPTAGGTVVSIANITATPSSNVTLPIMVENVNNLAAGTIWLTYDPNVVHVLSVSQGDLGGITTGIDNATGKTTMSVFTTAPRSGNVTFANVLLRAVGAVNNTSPLTLSVPALADQNGAAIPHTIKSGTFAISSIIKGDVSGDGQVTVVDALFIAQYTVGLRTLTSQQQSAADVNNDGQVTIVDALFIAQYTVGLRQL